MKIVHICLCGAMTDGLNYQENILSKYHKKMGNEVAIIASRYIWDKKGNLTTTTNNEYVNCDGIRVIRLKILIGTIDNKLKIYRRLRSTLENEKPDIIFVHDCQFLDILSIAKYAKRHKHVSIYIDNHVDYSNGARGWLSLNILHKGLWKHCIKRIIEYTTMFYGVLPSRVEFLIDVYGVPIEKCELLLMGADDDLISVENNLSHLEDIYARIGYSYGDFLIVTGGKIDLEKRQTINLLEAVKNLNDRRIKLIVFGPIINELKNRIISLVDEKNIWYVDWVDAKDTYSYFAAADLVVFPGRHSVFWEQVVAIGKPIMVKDWPGTHHIDIGGNVIYLSQDSTDEIETMLREIISFDNGLYYRMKENAEKNSRKQFFYSDIAKKSIRYS